MIVAFQQAVLLHQQGRFHEAIESYSSILRNVPQNVDVLNLLGLAHCQIGNYPEGIRLLKKCLKIRPDLVQAHANMGLALHRSGKLKEALLSLNRVVALKPEEPEGYRNLAAALEDFGKFNEAVGRLECAMKLQPEHAQTLYRLGNLMLRLARYSEAEDFFRQVVKFDVAFSPAWVNLGVVLNNIRGARDEAEKCFRRALELDGSNTSVYANLAAVLIDSGRYSEAELCCRQALAIDPACVDAHANLANVLRFYGRYAEAKDHFQAAVRVDPLKFDAWSGLLFVSNFADCFSHEERLELAREYGRTLSGRVSRRYLQWHCSPAPERLRVGFVSGDLKSHPVGYFLESLLSSLSAGSLDLLAYPTILSEDALTARIRPEFSAWTSIALMSDTEAAEQIRRDGVHVLIDLSGHTAGARLGIFAWKPAPIAVTWLGYFATTGVAEIDYLIADPVSVPESAGEEFSEKVWRLPETRLCFTAPNHDIETGTLPALRNGFLTFASVQVPSKISDAVLALWSRVLMEIPGSVLRLQAKPYGDSSFAKDFLKRCELCGIPRSRIRLLGETSRDVYLESYNEVDMVLDTFPYPGGTTTCEALWMGVPTLTLRGRNLLSNQGSSLLNAAGLREWIADDVEEYVRKAVAFASDTNRLAQLRAGLRAQVLVSPLFDAVRFARNFEESLWGMWRNSNELKAKVV